MRLLVPIGILFLTAGCSGGDKYTPEFTQTEVTTQLMDGCNLRLISIISNEYYFTLKQDEVRSRLETIVNGGEYNICSVKTLYSYGYLTAAKVTYDASSPGDGNEIRVLIIYSNEYYFTLKQDEVRSRLETIVNSEKYDIVRINTIYTKGYLFAAEVYYREK